VTYCFGACFGVLFRRLRRTVSAREWSKRMELIGCLEPQLARFRLISQLGGRGGGLVARGICDDVLHGVEKAVPERGSSFLGAELRTSHLPV
jgi:hypothetical protein